jgi:2-methylisocitrate lyase-like PEP mutase family enzyme
MDADNGKRLRTLVAARQAALVPGAANALAARIVEDLGFAAVYVTGAGVANSFFGVPDLGFLGLAELVQHTAAIRDAVELPIVVDADTGFGNALNVGRAVRALERAGANAVQIEDQVSPKRCGHFAGKEVVPVGEMVAKVRAAVDARRSGDFLVVARTDARAALGFDAAVERAARCIEAGADLTFVEAPETADELRRIPQLLAAPQIVNVVIGGRTPVLGIEELRAMGFAVVLYANAALQGAIRGMQQALGRLKAEGRLDEDEAVVASFGERQRLVGKPLFDALEKKYAPDA